MLTFTSHTELVRNIYHLSLGGYLHIFQFLMSFISFPFFTDFSLCSEYGICDPYSLHFRVEQVKVRSAEAVSLFQLFHFHWFISSNEIILSEKLPRMPCNSNETILPQHIIVSLDWRVTHTVCVAAFNFIMLLKTSWKVGIYSIYQLENINKYNVLSL